MKTWLAAVLILAAAGFVYFQSIRWLVEAWQVHPYYQQGFLVLLCAIGFAVYEIVWSNQQREPVHEKTWMVLLAVSALLYGIGWQSGLNFLKAVPIFLTLLAVVYLLADRLPARRLRFPILFPIIAIPIPFIPEITAFLQFAMAGLSTGFLQSFGMDIEAEGAMIYLPEATFLIAEPSSGIQSLIALLTLMIPTVHFTNTTRRKKIFLYACIVPVAVFVNFLRIVTLFIVGDKYGETFADQFWHDTGNVVYFSFALVIFFILWYSTVYGFKLAKPKPA